MRLKKIRLKNMIIAPATKVIIILFLINATSCAFKRVLREKDITYMEHDTAKSIPSQQLNIFSPRKSKDLKDVFIFIHGGSWKSGNKSHYSFLGNRMARKGVVTVVINYPLKNVGTYYEMAIASATAVSWVHKNIKKYGGNPEKIFVSGHSAGGHLAALISVKEEYFDSIGFRNVLKGTILIDAAGLNMYGYLKEEKFNKDHHYLATFTSDPGNWKEASPLYHLHSGIPAFLIYRGEKTYPSIIKSNEKFVKALKAYDPSPNYKILKGKKHIPMITQFLWTWNPIYKEINEFMGSEN